MKKVNVSRVFFATGLGVLCGVICYLSGKYVLNLPLEADNLIFILLNRTALGFSIGFADPALEWYIRGPILGVVIGSILMYYDYMVGFPIMAPIAVFVMNLLYGFGIDYLTTVVSRKKEHMHPLNG